jgi:hypothetical protein
MFYQHKSSLLQALVAAILLPLVVSVVASYALNTCDINEDGQVSTTDALFVLRKSVGLSAPACTAMEECESPEPLLRPSRGRLWNGLDCSSGSDAATLRLSNGQTWTASTPESSSSYQSITDHSPSSVIYEQCGMSFTFTETINGGPLFAAPERKITGFLVILDELIYGDFPIGMLVLSDEGPRSGAPDGPAMTIEGQTRIISESYAVGEYL